MGKLVCGCNEAKENCFKTCELGRLREPSSVYRVMIWPRVLHMGHIKALREKTIREIRTSGS